MSLNVKKSPFTKLHVGDCLEILQGYDSNVFDGVVTDPPYGISFSKDGWDSAVPGPKYWQEILRVSKPGSTLLAFGGTRTFHLLGSAVSKAGWEIFDLIGWVYATGFPQPLDIGHETENPDWLGWGVKLKPALEPVLVARKPNQGTFADNAKEWGVAGIKLDLVNGRKPANLVWDGSAEVSAELGGNSKIFFASKPSKQERELGLDLLEYADSGSYKFREDGSLDGKQTAARKNNHQTVKPLSLMSWLVGLVRTPRGGVILDPFCGSGTTGIAAAGWGMDFVGVDLEPRNIEISSARIEYWKGEHETKEN